MIRTVGILLLFWASLGASGHSLQPFFKPAPGNKESARMKNIDCIYVINLDRRPEKFESCVTRLAPFGIHPYRFSAVNGWELTIGMIDQMGVKLDEKMSRGTMGTYYSAETNWEPQHEIVSRIGQTYFSHCMSRGAIGIILSHLSILDDALRSGYKTIWIMEDDIEIKRDPRTLSDLIRKLDKEAGKEGWDILFTDRDTINQSGEYVKATGYAWRPNFKPASSKQFKIDKDISSDFRQIGARYGAYSMIVRRSGMKKILDFYHTYKIFLPYDMDFYQHPKIKMFTVRKDVVTTQRNAPSDNGGPNYLRNP